MYKHYSTRYIILVHVRLLIHTFIASYTSNNASLKCTKYVYKTIHRSGMGFFVATINV